nr:MAG TPA: hypothetical protein [Caudoviricetes sp.]
MINKHQASIIIIKSDFLGLPMIDTPNQPVTI